MGLLPSNVVRHGSIHFEGQEIGKARGNDMRKYWGTQMSMVFQDPMTSLNPVMRIGNQIMESLRFHFDVTKEYAEETALALLSSVGIPEAERRLREYPHQLSGGMRQRVMIAIALACGPKLLFADEPTTALDVTVQAQILDLLQQQQRERFMAMVLVTHDLGVVAGRTDDIAVMYAGRIVERAPTRSLFENTRHPYTEALLKSIPKLAQPSHSKLDAIAGRPPDLVKPPPGCKFAARCPYAQAKCITEEPPLIDAEIPGHAYRCFFPVGSQAGVEALARNLAAGETATGLPVRKDGEAVLTGVSV
jgi:peptide/nickel transport system ATP-binding protein